LKLLRRRHSPGIERAEDAYAQGCPADAAVLFRALAERGELQAQLRLAHVYSPATERL
jgi:hypothetical protein